MNTQKSIKDLLSCFDNIDVNNVSETEDFYILSKIKDIKKFTQKKFSYEQYEQPLKGVKTIEEQIGLLEKRNLKFSDKEKAKRLLKECQYYRITAYRYPFVFENNKDRFKDDIDFEDIWKLYVFDRRLRFLVIDAIERIEVSLRSRWAYVLAQKFGILAYQDNSAFKKQILHSTIAKIIFENIQTSDQPCITHYIKNNKKIPIWALCEIITYGELLSLFNAIKSRKIKNEILDNLEIDEKIASSFLNSLRIVRNICAHHGRLWNKRLFANLKKPNKPEELGLSMNYPAIDEKTDSKETISQKLNLQKSIYNILVMLVFFLDKIAPQSKWSKRLVELLQANGKYLEEMGFPQNWEKLPIWEKAFSA